VTFQVLYGFGTVTLLDGTDMKCDYSRVLSEIQLNCTGMKEGAVMILCNKGLSLIFRRFLAIDSVVKF
jgi:hypothetical protein